MTASARQILDWLAELGARVANPGRSGAASEEATQVSRIADLSRAGEDSLAFYFSRELEDELKHARPAILVTGDAFLSFLETTPLWESSLVISTKDPYQAMARLSGRFARSRELAGSIEGWAAAGCSGAGEARVHPGAEVDAEAELGPQSVVGPGARIEAGARIGARSIVGAGAFVGAKARIGDDCVIFPRAVLYPGVALGDRVRIHAGAVIGADGFGYAPRGLGKGHEKIHHLGSVRIGSDVEIGANACVDRGTFADTVIEEHAKIDNLVQIGHNARVEEGAILCGDVALAGGANVGRYAVIGGMTGICNRVRVGAGAKVAAQSLVSKDVPDGETVAGNPQRSHREHFRAHAALNRLVGKR